MKNIITVKSIFYCTDRNIHNLRICFFLILLSPRSYPTLDTLFCPFLFVFGCACRKHWEITTSYILLLTIRSSGTNRYIQFIVLETPIKIDCSCTLTFWTSFSSISVFHFRSILLILGAQSLTLRKKEGRNMCWKGTLRGRALGGQGGQGGQEMGEEFGTLWIQGFWYLVLGVPSSLGNTCLWTFFFLIWLLDFYFFFFWLFDQLWIYCYFYHLRLCFFNFCHLNKIS